MRKVACSWASVSSIRIVCLTQFCSDVHLTPIVFSTVFKPSYFVPLVWLLHCCMFFVPLLFSQLFLFHCWIFQYSCFTAVPFLASLLHGLVFCFTAEHSSQLSHCCTFSCFAAVWSSFLLHCWIFQYSCFTAVPFFASLLCGLVFCFTAEQSSQLFHCCTFSCFAAVWSSSLLHCCIFFPLQGKRDEDDEDMEGEEGEEEEKEEEPVRAAKPIHKKMPKKSEKNICLLSFIHSTWCMYVHIAMHIHASSRLIAPKLPGALNTQKKVWSLPNQSDGQMNAGLTW